MKCSVFYFFLVVLYFLYIRLSSEDEFAFIYKI